MENICVFSFVIINRLASWIGVLDSIVADPHIQIRVSQYGRWIKKTYILNPLFRRFDVQTSSPGEIEIP